MSGRRRSNPSVSSLHESRSPARKGRGAFFCGRRREQMPRKKRRFTTKAYVGMRDRALFSASDTESGGFGMPRTVCRTFRAEAEWRSCGEMCLKSVKTQLFNRICRGFTSFAPKTQPQTPQNTTFIRQKRESGCALLTPKEIIGIIRLYNLMFEDEAWRVAVTDAGQCLHGYDQVHTSVLREENMP